ncbi:MAG TPA: protein translocase subunit SecF [Dehalococcoidia bacterium]|nr:protein translocase subunit SecF [Dehalococcoidia bacterium]
MFDLVGKRHWFFALSGVIIIVGLVFLGIFRLKWGVDFSPGSELTVRFSQAVDRGALVAEMADLGYPDAAVQGVGENSYIIRTTSNVTGEELARIKDRIEEKLSPFAAQPTLASVGPAHSRQIVRGAAIAVAVGALGILLYIAWAFRRLPRPFRYGTCAIVGLLHDILVVVVVFSILGKLLNMEVDLMFVTGVLAVIGYSVNNTVVVFDRIRENLGRGIGANFADTVNLSLVQTLGRSLNTSLTTVFVLLALYLVVGIEIRPFILVLLVGVIAGTYSSLFIASQLLVVWERGEVGRLWLRLRPKR